MEEAHRRHDCYREASPKSMGGKKACIACCLQCVTGLQRSTHYRKTGRNRLNNGSERGDRAGISKTVAGIWLGKALLSLLKSMPSVVGLCILKITMKMASIDGGLEKAIRIKIEDRINW